VGSEANLPANPIFQRSFLSSLTRNVKTSARPERF